MDINLDKSVSLKKKKKRYPQENFTVFFQLVTCHFLHIVNPLILHCFKVFIGSLIARVSQQNTGGRYNLQKNTVH